MAGSLTDSKKVPSKKSIAKTMIQQCRRRGTSVLVLLTGRILQWLWMTSDVNVHAWMTVTIPTNQRIPRAMTSLQSSDMDNQSVDVSDLGLTMDDLEAPLPTELLQGMTTSGYQSTSRIPTANDNGCQWTERADGIIDATLAIPGLRGQPSACLAVLFSTTTATVTAFGRPVWSCIFKGQIEPDKSSFSVEDGTDMIPVIRVSVSKVDTSKQWKALYDQVGEDSLI
jgi:hypothetical protein